MSGHDFLDCVILQIFNSYAFTRALLLALKLECKSAFAIHVKSEKNRFVGISLRFFKFCASSFAHSETCTRSRCHFCRDIQALIRNRLRGERGIRND